MNKYKVGADTVKVDEIERLTETETGIKILSKLIYTELYSFSGKELVSAEWVMGVLDSIIGNAPSDLNTLEEIALAINNDPDFAATIVNSISTKVDKIVGKQLSTEDFTTSLLNKLNSISAGATANASDAQLRDRSTHSGTQLAATISDFNPSVDERISAKRDVANQLAPLDLNRKVPIENLPIAEIQAGSPQGIVLLGYNPGIPTTLITVIAGQTGVYSHLLDNTSTPLTADLELGVTYFTFNPVDGYWRKVVISVDVSAYLNQRGWFINSEPDNFYISDVDGNVVFEVTPAGVKYVGQVTQDQASVLNDIFDLNPEGLFVCDIDGNVAFKITSEGVKYIGQNENPDSITPVELGEYEYDYNHIIVYGQSLSVSGTFITPIDFYDTKTFSGGILTNYDPDNSAQRDAYYGSVLIPIPTSGTETQGKAISKIIKELIRDENKIEIANQNYTMIASAPGTAGASWDQLSNPTGDEYRRLIESVKKGKDFAIAEGKTYNVPILCYLQGENSNEKDDTITEFYNKLDTLFTNLNQDIKSITGQSKDVQFIVYQIASFSLNPPATVNPPLAQLKISIDKPNVHFGCAMYQMEYMDAVHGTSNTYRIMGAMMGVVAKRIMVDEKKMQPVIPKSWTIQKNEASTVWVINMKMNVPVMPLVFDTSVNSLYTTIPTNYGFSIKNGSTEIITNVNISRGDTLVIMCNQNPVGLELTYAINGRSSGGNLRDSQGEKVKISCEGVNMRVDNWCPIFKQVI
ncbi:hypothetical protein D3C80_658230 [compost metagenome]